MIRVIEIGVLLVLGLLSFVFPVFRLLPPTGPFPVGTTLLPSDDPSGLTLQIWYPAQSSACHPRAWYAPVGGGKRNKIFRWVRTASRLDAPPARHGSFPVLVYVNSYGGTRWENTALLQELASHGFVVAASDQPSGVLDGVDLAAPMDFSTDDSYAQTMRRIPVKLRAQVKTASQVLDRLAELNAQPASRFFGELDLAHAGIIGFSFGGATAAEAAVTDRRFRASVNMDGMTFGEAARVGPPYPYLEMSDATPPPTDTERRSSDPAVSILARAQDENDRHSRANFARNGGLYLTIDGSRHPNFSDYPILVPWRRMNGAGPIDPARAGEIVRYWAVGFFRATLQGGEMPGPTGNPGVKLESWTPPARNPASGDQAAPANPVGEPR